MSRSRLSRLATPPSDVGPADSDGAPRVSRRARPRARRRLPAPKGRRLGSLPQWGALRGTLAPPGGRHPARGGSPARGRPGGDAARGRRDGSRMRARQLAGGMPRRAARMREGPGSSPTGTGKPTLPASEMAPPGLRDELDETTVRPRRSRLGGLRPTGVCSIGRRATTDAANVIAESNHTRLGCRSS